MKTLNKFLNFVREEQLFTEQDRVLLAVSGGKDSVFMAKLISQTKVRFAIAHCNFQLREEESNQDSAFVENLSKEFNVPFFNTIFDTDKVAQSQKISIQMAARDLRYQWLEEVRKAEGYDYICVAHHQTDSLETVLLNMVRGTGIAGLHGILPKRGKLIRPILGFSGPEIAQYMYQNQVPYREDRTNKETKYARNKIRLDVLPALKSINPLLETTFYRSSKRFLALETFLNRQIETIRINLLIEKEPEVYFCSFKDLNSYADDGFVLYEVFKPFRFSESVIQDFMVGILEGKSGNLYYSDTHQLLLDREGFWIRKVDLTEFIPVPIEQLPRVFQWDGKEYGIRISTDVSLDELTCNPKRKNTKVVFDAQNVHFPLEIRPWQEGDSFIPLGMKGRKKISDFLIDQKVPLDQKKKLPLLINENREIIAVSTWRIDDRYKITTLTKKVIIFEQI